MMAINVSQLPPGEYDVEITLHGRRMKELDRKDEKFAIRWTEEGLLKLDWKSAVSQLSYVATPGEQSKLKKAKTMEERRAAFAEFWGQRDPTVGTPENETKREFYHRVNVADRQFSSMRREGWKSDRGRIYIIHGEPDQIDDEPYSPDVVPYQIWHYYREGRYRRFLFVDKNDDGDYRLQYPYDGLNQRPDF
jgi:GWxTD domain-containing protein